MLTCLEMKTQYLLKKRAATTFIAVLLWNLCLTEAMMSGADTDCPELVAKMKDKRSWWKKGDLTTVLVEWIKTSSIDELMEKSRQNLNIGVLIGDVPLTIGANTSEDQFRYMKQELAAGRKLVVVSHTAESYVEETLNPEFKDVLLACLSKDAQNGLFCRVLRSVNPDVVTLAMVYKPIAAPQVPKCKIRPVHLEGATYISQKEGKDLNNGYELVPHKNYFFPLRRETGGNTCAFKPIEYKFDTTQGHQIQGSLPPIPHPQTKRIVWRDSSKTEQVYGGNGNGGGGYMGVNKDTSPHGSHKIVLGPGFWPRLSQPLANNLSVVTADKQTGIWAIKQPLRILLPPKREPLPPFQLFDGESMKITFSNVVWNEDEHSLSFDWTAGINQWRQDVWEIHIRVTVNVLSKERLVVD
jgi:hypothetical protein